LTAPPFLETYAKLLISGGNVNLKTDSDLLFDYTRKTVVRWGGHVVSVLDDLHETGEGTVGARDVDLRGNIPSFVSITDAKVHESTFLMNCSRSRSIYVMDRVSAFELAARSHLWERPLNIWLSS
jgi:hypothetical protein